MFYDLGKFAALNLMGLSPQAAKIAPTLFSGASHDAKLLNRTRAFGRIGAVKQESRAAAHALGDAAGPTSSEWLASRSGWQPHQIASPDFGKAFHNAVG